MSTLTTSASLIADKNISTRDITVYNTSFEGKNIPEFTKTLKSGNIYIYEQYQDDGLEVQFLGTVIKSCNSEPYFCFRTLGENSRYFEQYMNPSYMGKIIIEVDADFVECTKDCHAEVDGLLEAFGWSK